MLKHRYNHIETMGDVREKNLKIYDNNKILKEIDLSIKEIMKDMSELKKEVREVLELVRKKEERDMNKWLTWG